MSVRTINMVTVPVADQERARAFYVDGLGFSVKFDYLMDAQTAGSAGEGARWLMLTPPGGGADITLSTWSAPAGTARLSMDCDDVDATHAALHAAGLVPNNDVQDAVWGRWFGIDDPDGNNLLIVQAP